MSVTTGRRDDIVTGEEVVGDLVVDVTLGKKWG